MVIDHLHHFEDLVLLSPDLIEDILGDIYDNLDNLSQITSIKFDGAPSIIVGRTWEDAVFVATKGLFNASPKYYTSPSEIEVSVSDPILAQKLRNVLASVQCSNTIPKGIALHGDMMYYDGSELESAERDGKHWTVIHPNTIAYLTPLCALVPSVGIAWHTMYTFTGPAISRMQMIATGPLAYQHAQQFLLHCSVWGFDVTLDTPTTTVLSSLQTNIRGLRAVLARELIDIPVGARPSLVRACNAVFHTDHIGTLYDLTSEVLRKVIIDNIDRQAATGISRYSTAKRIALEKLFWEEIAQFVRQPTMDRVIDAYRYAMETKQLLFNALTMMVHKSTPIPMLVDRDTDELTPTSHEGFVVTIPSRDPFKVVDRFSFSRANFSDRYKRGWQHQ